ncbi:hypothetical protein SNE40_018485 [Patella caerulea]|uniref:Sialate O-acetylesterase domain-containing protein n=1 Tax=Patella caerulea TaxID=87958 RepID=A0AAN8J789_PATCE
MTGSHLLATALIITGVAIQLVIPASTGQNGFSFASYYNDHMVLQKAPKKSNIWGYSTKLNDVVHVTIQGGGINHTVQTQVYKGSEGKGVWKVALPAVPAGGPYTVKATSSLANLILKDILFGDIWICSGQSNMQFTLTMGLNISAEIADGVNYPNIRLFTVRRKESKTRQYDLIDIEQNWSLPSKTSLGGSPWTHFSSVCWFYGKDLYNELKYPIGLIASSWGGTLVESWSPPEAMSKCGAPITYGPQPGFPRDPSVLWNAMISPFLPFTIYGAIWYQGESNSGHGDRYNCSFPTMIDDWRDNFNKESGGQTSRNFPFGFVQLAANNNNPKSLGMTDIRWAQTASFGYVPNSRMHDVFMAVSLDLPDYNAPMGSIHPRHKKIVCDRLALAGLSVAYHKTGKKFQGPYPSKITNHKTGSTVTVEFDHGKSPLDVRAQDGFEVCCVSEAQKSGCNTYDKNWHAAPVSNSTKTSVTIHYPDSCRQHLTVKAVRYLWRESPCVFLKCPVYSVENQLPAPPFLYHFPDLGDVHIIG